MNRNARIFQYEERSPEALLDISIFIALYWCEEFSPFYNYSLNIHPFVTFHISNEMASYPK